MASRHRRRADAGSASGPGPREEVERLLARRRFKDAVKHAKLCHRQEETPETHRLLERAYFERARQLQQDGMTNSGREVAQHLLDFGVTDPELVEPLAEVLLVLGMSDRGLALQDRLEAPEARERLARQAADQAVLHPDRAPTSPELVEGSRRVRSALQALEAGDEAKALDAVRDVARGSPFGDWKRFLRGLAAYQRRDGAEAHAHWERLDPARAPSRIARALEALDRSEPDSFQGSDESGRALEPLERWAFGEPVLRPLRELSKLVAEDRWAEAVRVLGPLRYTLRRLDPALAERLTLAPYVPVIQSASVSDYHEGRALLRNFTKAAEPLPIDPRWNRLWAMAWERAAPGTHDEAEDFWRKYLDDLKTNDDLRPEERSRAQAIVWLHLGRASLALAEDLALSGPSRRSVDPETREERQRAVRCLEESLRLDPELQAPFRSLASAYQQWDEPERVAAVARRRLQAVPEDFEALLLLADHHFLRDEPVESLEYARRARALKPLDEATVSAEWAARVALARHRACEGRFEEGRDELAAANRLRPDPAHSTLGLARKAVFELKAGRSDLAEPILAEAQGQLVEPTPLWLALSIEAARYQLPREERERFEARWGEALPKKVRHETAGALADIVGAFLLSQIDYPGRGSHVQQVLEYLGRTTRIKYGRKELDQACSFLGVLFSQMTQDREPWRGARIDAVRTLYEKLAKRGVKLFPEAPQFPMILGSLALEKGPMSGNFREARKHAEKAVELALAAEPGDPQAAAILPQARQLLTTLDDLSSGPMGSPFGPMSGTVPMELLDALNEIFGDMDDFDEDEDEEEDDYPRRPARRAKGKKRKRR